MNYEPSTISPTRHFKLLSMNRKKFIQQTSLASAALLFNKYSFALTGRDFPVVRVPEAERKFKSEAVENLIKEISRSIGNKELAWLFGNCFPNTLDTTVEFEIINGKPDTFVITGDIDAMWLRDSSAQVWPYLPLMKSDKKLQELIKGVINRQVKCILKDPYANAFYKDETKISEWKSDKTVMKPGVHERKWEVDSLCYPIRLAAGYYEETGDTSPFDADWLAAMKLVLQTFREQQRIHDNGPYKFQRETTVPTDTAPMGGYGNPTKKIGLLHSMFRASDDATLYPFNIPENLFALYALKQLSLLVKAAANDEMMQREIRALGGEINTALNEHGIVQHPKYGKIYAYEVDGFGNYILMDDSNVPGLLSIPYLSGLKLNIDEAAYRTTRKLILSDNNPYFFKGRAAEGIGGPHVGMDYIWPMSIIMRAMTSTDNNEISECLKMLRQTHAGTGFMHEGFHKDDATKFTRKWFAWANTLFGELVWKIYREKKELLN